MEEHRELGEEAEQAHEITIVGEEGVCPLVECHRVVHAKATEQAKQPHTRAVSTVGTFHITQRISRIDTGGQSFSKRTLHRKIDTGRKKRIH